MWLLLPQVPVPRTPPPPEPGTHAKEGPALGTHDTLAESTAGRVTTKGTFVTVPRPPVEHVGHSPAHPTVLGALRACEGIARPLQFAPLHFHAFSLWEKEKSLSLPLKPITSLSALKHSCCKTGHFRTFGHWTGSLAPVSFLALPADGKSRVLWASGGSSRLHTPLLRHHRAQSPGAGGRLRLLS